MSTLKLPGRAPLKPKKLVTDWFDPKQPMVCFLGLDNSRTLYNVEGWRANALPKLDDPELTRICAPVGRPDGISSEEVTLPETPTFLIIRERSNGKLYKHIEENGRVMWLPRQPLNIKPDEL